MKHVSFRVLLFIAAVIGASFNVWYLIDHHVYSLQLSATAPFAYFLNAVLFFLSLAFCIYTIFIKNKQFSFFGYFLVGVGLAYLVLMFSFVNISYLYLVPFSFYIATGYVFLKEKPAI